MATMEKIVKQTDLLGYRGEKGEEYLKQEFKLLAERPEKKEEAERQAREKKEEAERQAREKKEEAERQAREKKKKLIARKGWRWRRLTGCGDEAVTGKNCG
ncbi:hypothetical protein PoB_005503600 [Plakobranchus ocellatus]|uniref:Troponin T n=1 Tax=Plakobranchus ocellatus TaxID=259542 RepID=A0AAV4CB23_9GAST|nr:hypothetical protein PoB_005503600 [Plakobranchus ocellatus]